MQIEPFRWGNIAPARCVRVIKVDRVGNDERAGCQLEIYDEECFAVNTAEINVSKGKSMVSVLRPFKKTAAKPFEVHHTSSEIKRLADGRLPEKKCLIFEQNWELFTGPAEKVV